MLLVIVKRRELLDENKEILGLDLRPVVGNHGWFIDERAPNLVTVPLATGE